MIGDSLIDARVAEALTSALAAEAGRIVPVGRGAVRMRLS